MRELPPDYYLDHFQFLIDHFQSCYPEGFDEALEVFIEEYSSLSVFERRFLLRAYLRKPRVYWLSEFDYADIPEPDKVYQQLLQKKWLRSPEYLEIYEYLEGATKAELSGLLKGFGVEHKKSARREILLEKSYQLEHQDLAKVISQGPFVIAKRESFDFLNFLYFGKSKGGLQKLTLRYLGVMRTRGSRGQGRARFSDMWLAKQELRLRSVLDLLQAYSENYSLQFAKHNSLEIDPTNLSEAAEQKFNQTLVHINKLSKLSNEERILWLSRATAAPARMKYVRWLYKDGQKQAAREKLEVIMQKPSSDEELMEASDFFRLKFSDGGYKTSLLTEILRDSHEIVIDESYRGSAEWGIRNHLADQGMKAERTENNFFLAAFSIFFWDELFGRGAKGFHNEFDRIPSGLKDGSFLRMHNQSCQEKFEKLQTGAWKFLILKSFSENYGKGNPFFIWRKSLLGKLNLFFEKESPDRIQSLFELMCSRFMSYKSGFPDISVFEFADPDRQPLHLEVKAEGDALRRNQLVMLEKMSDLGFDVGVLRARYSFNPDTEYVVVDVETTGGRAGMHRVTEIGAVKMKGFEVIGEFETLINPERPIPKSITRLTGITNSMVAEAPVFAAISAQFREFLGEAVFVAHNVRFDYSFIQKEFERAGMLYRAPTACTVALARKTFKGLKSYGLANLCKHFEIGLDEHHRALCDARAAAEVLNLINKERSAELSHSHLSPPVL